MAVGFPGWAAHEPTGTNLLASRLTAAQIATAPPVDDLDALLVDDLTDDEYKAFLEALNS